MADYGRSDDDRIREREGKGGIREYRVERGTERGSERGNDRGSEGGGWSRGWGSSDRSRETSRGGLFGSSAGRGGDDDWTHGRREEMGWGAGDRSSGRGEEQGWRGGERDRSSGGMFGLRRHQEDRSDRHDRHDRHGRHDRSERSWSGGRSDHENRQRSFGQDDDRHRDRGFGPDDRHEGLPVDETSRLIASNKVEGTVVYGSDGRRMGSIFNFMVDKRSGKVEYAVMSYGGFLGMGTRYYPMPWDILSYDTRLGGYRVDMMERDLERAPSFDRDSEPSFDTSYGRRVRGWYGLGN
ncbi:MAG TPA: PRC-barrel domain-containing protein [Allosphingosinicella sp.]|nr:PRC-barrel domain-containing protein [Allosphingosinicella sp.]